MSRITIKQHDSSDCGAACLASVAAHYHLRLPLARLRQYAATGPEGTTALGLVRAAERLGFVARAVRGPLESLRRVPLPVIAHVQTAGGMPHFQVVVKISAKRLCVMDPADGRLHRLSLKAFEKRWTGVLVLLLPGDHFRPGNERVSAGLRLWHLLCPYTGVLLQVFIGSLMLMLMGLAPAVFVQKVVDHVLPSGNIALLNLMGMAMLFLLVFQGLVDQVKTTMIIKVGQRLDVRLILGFYRHVLQLPQSFFDRMRVGELLSRVSDAMNIRLFISETLTSMLVNLLVLLGAFALMFGYYWKLALVLLLILPLHALIYALLNRANRRTQRGLMEKGADLESHLAESLRGAGTIKSLGVEEQAAIKTENRLFALLRVAYRASINALIAGNAATFSASLFTLLLLWMGAGFVMQQALTPGELLSCYALFGYLSGPASSLIEMNRNVQDALIAAARLFEIMDLEREDQPPATAACEQPTRLNPAEAVQLPSGPLTFRHVSFRYEGQPLVLEGLDLSIPRGRITALVGPSGSGKSTLSALLQRRYSPESGSINIGGLDLRYLGRDRLRRLISVVPQQIDLFSGSILENIAPGVVEPDLERIWMLCRQLGMTEFIEALPSGLFSLIGENGMTLSGGQRQRLAIVRAFYSNPQILILDEAISSLDLLASRYILQAIRNFCQQGKTVLMIAHRLSTVQQADHIIVLERGKVREQGLHSDLLRQRGIYHRMWQAR